MTADPSAPSPGSQRVRDRDDGPRSPHPRPCARARCSATNRAAIQGFTLCSPSSIHPSSLFVSLSFGEPPFKSAVSHASERAGPRVCSGNAGRGRRRVGQSGSGLAGCWAFDQTPALVTRARMGRSPEGLGSIRRVEGSSRRARPSPARGATGAKARQSSEKQAPDDRERERSRRRENRPRVGTARRRLSETAFLERPRSAGEGGVGPRAEATNRRGPIQLAAVIDALFGKRFPLFA